jgi:hypothetical protein
MTLAVRVNRYRLSPEIMAHSMFRGEDEVVKGDLLCVPDFHFGSQMPDVNVPKTPKLFLEDLDNWSPNCFPPPERA